MGSVWVCPGEWGRVTPYAQSPLVHVGSDVAADGEAAQGGEGVVDAYAFVVRFLDFLGVDAHVAVEVVAEGHGC